MNRISLLLLTGLLLQSASAQADDTAALQAAITESGGFLQLENRVYEISKSINIPLNETGPVAIRGTGTTRIKMAGAGPAFHFTGTHDGSAAPRTFKPEVWERERGPVVADLEIIGAHPEADGIQAEGTMQLRISGVTVRKARHGIHLYRHNRNVIISDCNLYENEGIGLFLDDINLHQINVANSHISYNRGGGIVCIGGVGGVRNLHITGCDIESNFHEEGPVTANILVDSRKNSSGGAEISITGCTIQHTANSPDSANIRIFGGAQPIGNIEKPQLGHVTITGNILSDVQTNIHLEGCRGVAITGNTLWQAAEYNLLIKDCTALVMGANVLDRNPYYNRNPKIAANKNAVAFINCQDSTIQGLHVSQTRGNDAAVLFENCRRLHILGLTILDCEGVELVLKNCHDCLVNACLLSDTRENAEKETLQVEGGQGNRIDGK